MDLSTDYRAVFVTVSSKAEATKIAQVLLTEKLAACVNVIAGVESYFWWDGKIDHATEQLLIIKTTRMKIPELTKSIKRQHSYDLCEIITLPILEGNPDYLKWIAESVKSG